ncbi:MAG: carboxypeptidase-like regulatory domain-containing protein [Bacteroidales bacterium]
MKKVFLSIIFVALLGFVYADNEGNSVKTPENTPVEMVSLTGSVIDFQSGEALTGVEVSIEGTEIKAYTDFDGNFKIDNMKPGNYNIIASYISYDKSLVENFTANKDQKEVNIKLQESK